MEKQTTHTAINESKAFSAIDVGSTKVAAITGYRNEQGEIVIVGSGVVYSQNLDIDKEQEVLNIENIRAAVCEAVEKARNEAGFFCNNVVVGTAGRFVRSSLNRLEFKRLTAYTAITEEELNQFAQKFNELTNHDEEILHVKELNYMVDQDFYTTAPIGKIGSSISLNVCVVKMKSSYLQQLRTLMSQCNLQVSEFMFEPIASATSVLSETEKQNGCSLVDIGGGTTDIAIYENGVLQFAEVVPFGGNTITNDIRQLHILNELDGGNMVYSDINWKIAESLKKKHGKCLTDESDKGIVLKVAATTEREELKINLFDLTQTVQNRMEEIVASVYGLINHAQCTNALKQGLILTGGGAELGNVAYFFEQNLHCSVRVATPNMVVHSKSFDSNNPRYATVVGLLMRAAEIHAQTYIAPKETPIVEAKPIETVAKTPIVETPKASMVENSQAESVHKEKKKQGSFFSKFGNVMNNLATTVFDNDDEDK